jgi:hypothetical protein
VSPPAPAAAPPKTNLVKPGASWRSVLSGVPDMPSAAPAPAASEQAGAQRAAAAAGGKGAGRESKRSKARAVLIDEAGLPAAHARLSGDVSQMRVGNATASITIAAAPDGPSMEHAIVARARARLAC